MLESSPAAASGPSTSTMTTAQHQQMARQISSQADFAEEYFASLSVPAKRLIEDVVAVKEAYEDVWTGLETSEQEEILNESIIRPDAILRYEGHVTIRDSSSAKHHPKNQAETSAEVCRLSSFGVDKVFPRLKVQSGQKDVTYEDTSGSQGEDLGSDCTYSSTYRDEHSAPWTWMTRSQQELRFESGTAESVTSEELAEQGLETLNVSSPSRVLQRQSLLIRQSKGNPLYAKPVGIPIVPELPKQENIVKMESKLPSVSPHKINNFVYEEDNRIILDFGPNNVVAEDRTHSPSSESSKSSSGLLAKMKVTKANLKKSLSNVSNAGGTLRRKRSQKQNICEFSQSFSSSSPVSTLSSTTSAVRSSMTSLASSSKPPPPVASIMKPSGAPPPPPPMVFKPTTAPPPPPPTASSMTQSLYIPKNNKEDLPSRSTSKETEDDVVKPLEEFKIADLNTESEIPKTGFDFLDNW